MIQYPFKCEIAQSEAGLFFMEKEEGKKEVLI